MGNKSSYLRRAFLWLPGLLMLSSCGRLGAIPAHPPPTPESWLAIPPYVRLALDSREIVLVQPSSSILVYLLGVVAIVAGLSFWPSRDSHRSRAWWAVALLLWGLGALLAGTSYQAFSYEIKCAGREACAWTSWWEVGYLVLSAASVDAMVLAGAYSSAGGKLRAAMSAYAQLNAAAYSLVVLVGALIPIKFLISFELLLLAAAPGVLLLFVLSARRAYRQRDRLHLVLAGAWLWLGITLGAYFLYLVSGLTEVLWARGAWFSENDVLHIGLILWMAYLGLIVRKQVVDVPGGARAASPAATR